MVIQIAIGPDFDLKLVPRLDEFDDEEKMMVWFQKYKPVLSSDVRKYLDESGFRKGQAISNDQRHPERTRC
jgi:hypothetical protein